MSKLIDSVIGKIVQQQKNPIPEKIELLKKQFRKSIATRYKRLDEANLENSIKEFLENKTHISNIVQIIIHAPNEVKAVEKEIALLESAYQEIFEEPYIFTEDDLKKESKTILLDIDYPTR